MKRAFYLTLLYGLAAVSSAEERRWKSCEILTKPIEQDVKGIVLRLPGQTVVERRKSRAEENAILWVYLENVNPYKFAYSARAERFQADDATIQRFLEIIGLKAPAAPAVASAGCGRNQVRVDKLGSLISPLRDDLNKLVEELNQTGGVKQNIEPDYKKFLEDTDRDWLAPESLMGLCTAAEALAEQMKPFQAAGLQKRATAILRRIEAQKSAIKKALEELTTALDKDKSEWAKLDVQIRADEEKIKRLAAEAENLRKATPPDEAGAKAKLEEKEKVESGLAEKQEELKKLAEGERCRAEGSAGAEWIKLAQDDSKALIDKSKESVEVAKQLEEDGKKFANLLEIIRDAHTHEDPLSYRKFRFDTGSDGETDRLVIERKNLREKNATLQPVARVELTGAPDKFSLSGGVGFSTLSEKKVIRQTSRGDENGEPVPKFEYDLTHQGIRPAVVVLLNAHLRKFSLFEKKDATFAISSGVIGTGRGDGTQIEYVAGPSLGLLRNKMFLTLGLHLGKVEKLAGGFNIGDRIPDQIQGQLPTRRRWRPAVIFSLSYSFHGSEGGQAPGTTSTSRP